MFVGPVVKLPKASLACLALAGAIALAGCRGWQVGPQSLYRPDIRTVHVPIFESDSYRRYLGERLTEAVIKQIELRTPYKVVDADSADSVLSGRIIHDTKRNVVENAFDESRVTDLEGEVAVSWKDRRGMSLISTRSLPLEYASLNVGASSSFLPEAGQSVTTAQQRVIDRMAAQIVSQMEMAW